MTKENNSDIKEAIEEVRAVLKYLNAIDKQLKQALGEKSPEEEIKDLEEARKIVRERLELEETNEEEALKVVINELHEQLEHLSDQEAEKLEQAYNEVEEPGKKIIRNSSGFMTQLDKRIGKIQSEVGNKSNQKLREEIGELENHITKFEELEGMLGKGLEDAEKVEQKIDSKRINIGQNELKKRIKEMNPSVQEFVKDSPTIGYKITENSLPKVIEEYLGDVDDTSYSEEYIIENKGSVINLQIEDGQPDFYVIGAETFKNKYRKVDLETVEIRNKEYFESLMQVKGLSEIIRKRNQIVGILKQEPVEMVRLSELGFNTNQRVVIQAPWGGAQEKPPGKDGYIVLETEGDQLKQVYLVNQGKNGNPINYIPRNG